MAPGWGPANLSTMRPLRLSTLLIGVNAGLVLLAVVCVVFASVGLLRRLADQQALARVDLAGKSALEAVERSEEDVRTSARLLGERPTVGRLLRAGDAAGLAAFLESFRRTSRLTGCAVLVEGRPFAQAGQLAGRLTAGAPVASYPGATASVALALDQSFVEGVSAQVGLPVTIVLASEAAEQTGDARYLLRDRVLATGRPASERLDEAGAYVSILPVAGALLETSLPTQPIASVAGRLRAHAAAAVPLGGAARHGRGMAHQPPPGRPLRR